MRAVLGSVAGVVVFVLVRVLAMTSPYLTVREAAALLKMHPGSVYRLYAKGRLMGRKFGRSVRISRADVERMQFAG